MKGFVYNCFGGMSSKIQFPKDDRIGLQLVQPYLVLQIFVPRGQHFSLELRAADTQGTRRKMYFSTSFSELKTNPLHCQIPLSMIMRNTWLSLALDVPDLFQSCFRVLNFRSLDVIILGPVCKLRKIFTLRNRLAQSVLEAKENEECLPVEHSFAVGVDATVQVIDTQKVRNLLGIASDSEGRGSLAAPASVAQKRQFQRMERHTNGAFGTRTPLPVSTVRLNTNLPHDAGSVVGFSQQPSHLSNVDEAQTVLQNLKVSETRVSSSHARTRSSGRQFSKKGVNLVMYSSNMSRHSWDSASFPVQEEHNVDNLEAPGSDVLNNNCVDLPSKHGRKVQKINKRKEINLQKTYQFVKTSQKGSNKSRAPKELEVKESPPGSPPSGWENPNGSSENLLFEQHFQESTEYLNKGTSTKSYMMNGCNDSTHENNESFQTSIGSGCIVDEDESYFEKNFFSKPRNGFSRLQLQDHSICERLSNDNCVANTNDCLYEEPMAFPQKDLRSNTCEDYSARDPDSSQQELTKPTEHALVTKVQEASAPFEQSLSFGSTEELWVVHEEGAFGDPGLSLPTSGLGEGPFAQEDIFTESRNPQSTFVSCKPEGGADVTSGPNIETHSISAQAKNFSEGGPPTSKKMECNMDLQQTKKSLSRNNEMRNTTLISNKSLPSKMEDKELDLLYDPVLDCYYDPKTNRYYELK
ncbi:hypothetical protein KP509_16G048600 [Ceratopteris richardii]|uniref:CFA20 domain-containing protein n=1 Tax=Ceratopteris richardii TaxID=49495 RepID=A0A8T2T2T2_CERRI|nr:hypothetical protein KP509_16G048600 [Ceratopteris richardii]